MALATANRAQIAYVVESAFGVIPATPVPNLLRFTGESLDFALTKVTSKEIRSDRAVTDLISTGAAASGGINFELSYKEYDPFIEAILGGTWARFGIGATGTSSVAFTGTIDSTAGTITAASAPTGLDAFTGMAVGQWFRLTAPSDAADGAFLKILTRTITVITVDTTSGPAIPGTGSRAAVANCKVTANRVSNGTTARTFVVERGLADVGQYFAHRGMGASKMTLNLQSGNLVTGTIDFMGKDAVRATSTQLIGTPVAATTYDITNAVSGVGTVYEGGAALAGTYIKKLDLSIDGKLRALDAIGTLGAVQINQGTFAITGTMEVYLANGTLYDKFLNSTASSLSLAIKDGSNNGYQITLPKIKYGQGKVAAGGLDTDVMLTLPFTALFDPTSGKEIIVDGLGI